MLDVGWTELLLIGVVALIVIGPQDLPDMFRTLGRFTAKLRSMSRDFQRAMDQAAKESGVKDIARDLNTMTNPASAGLTAMKQAADRFEKWDPLKPATAAAKEPLKPAPMPPSPLSAAAQATAAQAANPSLAPVGGLGAAPTAEELADAEPEIRSDVGPETRALYEKKAKADAARATKRAAAAPAAEPEAKPAGAAPKPARRAPAKAKAAEAPAAGPAPRGRKPAATAKAAAAASPDATPKSPRRRKADLA